jgi:hypothetical protein
LIAVNSSLRASFSEAMTFGLPFINLDFSSIATE